MPTPIPDKGKVLNRLSEFWFELTADIVPNHFVSDDVPDEVAERAMRVRRLEMYPVECVVRGYLIRLRLEGIQGGGAVCGIELPAGLLRVRQAARADLHAGDQGRDRRPRRERSTSSGRRRSSVTGR